MSSLQEMVRRVSGAVAQYLAIANGRGSSGQGSGSVDESGPLPGQFGSNEAMSDEVDGQVVRAQSQLSEALRGAMVASQELGAISGQSKLTPTGYAVALYALNLVLKASLRLLG